MSGCGRDSGRHVLWLRPYPFTEGDELGSRARQCRDLVGMTGVTDTGYFQKLRPPQQMLFHFIERRAAAAPIRLAEHHIVGTGFAREHGVMTAEKAAGAGNTVRFQERERGDKGLYSGDVGAVGACARRNLGMALDEQCDITTLDNGGDRLGALDLRALVAIREPQQHGGDIARDQSLIDMTCKRRRIFDARRDEIKPLACGFSSRHAAFRSRSTFHCPSVASPFIMARWPKARCAAATFSDLPDQVFCGAACSARP